jgi:hypothetical protein
MSLRHRYPDIRARQDRADTKRGAINNPTSAHIPRPPRAAVHLCPTCGQPFLFTGSPVCGRC